MYVQAQARLFLAWMADAIINNTSVMRPQDDYEIWGDYLNIRTVTTYKSFFDANDNNPLLQGITGAQLGQYFRYQPYIKAMGQQRVVRPTRPKVNHMTKTITVQRGQTTSSGWFILDLRTPHEDLPPALHNVPLGYKKRVEDYAKLLIAQAQAQYPSYRVLYLQRLSEIKPT